MSSLNLDDGHMHHHDGSHRWTGGPAHMPIEVWHAILRQHMAEHLATQGRVGAVDPVGRSRIPISGWPVHAEPMRGGATVMQRRPR